MTRAGRDQRRRAYESVRNEMLALDFATQAQEMKVIGGQPDFALGGIHAVTHDLTVGSRNDAAVFARSAHTGARTRWLRHAAPP